MRIGVVGAGRIGASHAAVVAGHPDVAELVVADADPQRAREVAGRLGARVASVDEVFDSAHRTGSAGGMDGIVIAAPTDTHAELLCRGARAGVPLFCEKPVAADVEGTLAVLREVRRAGVPVQIGFQRRFDAGYARARDALHDGELGDLHRVHLVTADPEPPSPSYVPVSGGIYRDCHIHDFDILRWVTGREVVEVYATGSNRGADYFAASGDVDTSVALLRLDDDTLATLHGARYNGGGYDVRMELAGTRATYAVGLDARVPLRSAEPGVGFPAAPAWPDFRERFAPAYVAELRAFVDLVKGGGPSACDVQEALEALYVAEAADRSRREGRPVRVAEVRR